MSLDLMAAAWTSGVAPVDRLVLLALADWGNARGECWPSMPTIAAKTGVDVRTARRVIARLAAAGHLTRVERPGKGVLYTVHPGQPDPGHADPGHSAPRTENALTPDTLPPNTLRTVIKRKKTSSSPSTRETEFRSIAGLIDLPDLPLSASIDQWADFAAMRAAMTKGAKPKPWTSATASKAIARLHELVAEGHDAGAVLDASVLNGWQGLFPLKPDRDGGASSLRGSRPDPALDLLRAARAAEWRDRPSGWAARPGMEGMEPASLDDDEFPPSSYWRNP